VTSDVIADADLHCTELERRCRVIKLSSHSNTLNRIRWISGVELRNDKMMKYPKRLTLDHV